MAKLHPAPSARAHRQGDDGGAKRHRQRAKDRQLDAEFLQRVLEFLHAVRRLAAELTALTRDEQDFILGWIRRIASTHITLAWQFGRRAPENTNLGTDHGAAGTMFMVGSKLKGGHYGKPVSLTDRLLYTLGDVLVYGPLRNVLGMSRIKVAYTAGEAIGPDLFSFYRSIGVNLKQLYGSTETAVFVCVQPNGQVKPDTVGPPLAGVELKIKDNGEILLRSPGLLKEYYKNPGATAEVIANNVAAPIEAHSTEVHDSPLFQPTAPVATRNSSSSPLFAITPSTAIPAASAGPCTAATMGLVARATRVNNCS